MKISEMSNTSLRVLTGALMAALLAVILLLEFKMPSLHIIRWVSVLIAGAGIVEFVKCLINADRKKLQQHAVVYIAFLAWLILMLFAAYFVGLRPGIILWVFMIIIGADTGAWFIGNVFGGDKMWEKLSEHKTWSGQIGGIICGTLMSILYFKIFGGYLPNAIWVGISVALLSQYGDLTASFVKRNLGIKDFGNTLPGHGGILDRFDGWIYVLPLIWFMIG